MNQKTKVAFLLNSISNGGIEHFYLNYLQNTSKLNEFQFYLIYTDRCNISIEKKFRDLGFEIIKTKKPLYENQLYYLLEIFRIFKKNDFDVIHCNLNYSNFYALLVGKILGIKVRISHSHMNMSNEVVTVSLNFVQRLIRSFKIYLSDVFATKRIACSFIAGDTAFRHDYQVVYNAIDIRRFLFDSNLRKKMRNEFGVHSSLYGFFGRFTEEKNPEFAYQVFRKIKEVDRFSKFLFIGDGNQKKYMIEQFENSGFSKDIIYIESVDDIQKYYHALDLLLFPSVSEGLGMVAIEGQLNGVSVLASNGVPRDVEISNHIQFLDLNDSLMTWVDKSIELSKFSHENVIFNNQVKNFDISVQADLLFDLYLEK